MPTNVLWVLYAGLTLAAIFITAPPHALRDRRAVGVWATLLVLLPVGQTLGNSRLSYPFVNWGMYAEPAPPRAYRDYLLVTDDGRRIRYPFRHVAFSSPWAWQAKLDVGINRCGCSRGDLQVDGALAALAHIHEERSDDRVAHIEVYDVRVSNPDDGVTPAAVRLRYRWSPANR